MAYLITVTNDVLKPPNLDDSSFIMSKAYTVIVLNHFFVNNCSKSEPIPTKFYRESYRVTWYLSPANYWRRSLNGRKWRRKKHCANFCHQINTSFHPLPGRRFPWKQNANRCGHEFFRNRILKFFRKGVIYPEKNSFMGVGVHPARTLQLCLL